MSFFLLQSDPFEKKELPFTIILLYLSILKQFVMHIVKQRKRVFTFQGMWIIVMSMVKKFAHIFSLLLLSRDNKKEWVFENGFIVQKLYSDMNDMINIKKYKQSLVHAHFTCYQQVTHFHFLFQFFLFVYLVTIMLVNAIGYRN